MKLTIPKDNEFMTKKFKIRKGGICGQACLSVIENSTIQEVMDNWKKLGLEFKGWSGWKQLREYLEKRGFIVKQKKSDFKEFKEDCYYIARVQWIGDEKEKEKPFYGWGHWSEASAHTHFIVIANKKFFCNEDGLFDLKYLKEYLGTYGVITSYMEIRKQR